MRSAVLLLLVGLGGALNPLPSDTAVAQATCPEGRLSNGQCADPVLGAAVRETLMVFSQPKISYTAFPILPSLDYRYRYPHELIPDPLRPTAGGGKVCLSISC